MSLATITFSVHVCIKLSENDSHVATHMPEVPRHRLHRLYTHRGSEARAAPTPAMSFILLRGLSIELFIDIR